MDRSGGMAAEPATDGAWACSGSGGSEGRAEDAACAPIRLLGTPALGDPLRAVGLRYRKGWVLLAYLALERRAHRRVALAWMLWPTLSEAAALTNLRQVVADLRRALRAIDRDAWLCGTRDTVALDPQARCDTDALEVGCASAALGDAMLDGRLLDGVEIDDGAEVRTWLDAARMRCAAYAAHRLERRRDALLAAARPDLAIGPARRLLAADPCNERHARALMAALAAAGAPELARLEFEQLRQRLRSELCVAPAPATLQLAASLHDDLHAGRSRQLPFSSAR